LTVETWKADLTPLLAPKSVAIVGASDTEGTWGKRIFDNLRRTDYRGAIYAVNPRRRAVWGGACYPDLAALPEPVEMLVVAVPKEGVLDVIRQAGARGVAAALVVAAGFSEVAGGEALQAELKAEAERCRIRLCGPNCEGNLSLHEGFAPYVPRIHEPLQPGPLGFVSQSGTLVWGVHQAALGRGLGCSYLVGSGNEAVLEVPDYLAFMLRDPRTRVVGAYVEGFKDPARFVRVAALARHLDKPLLVIKAGRSEAGIRAVRAHTGSLAGSDVVHDAVFRRHGVIRMEDVDELVETAELLCHRAPAVNRSGLAAVVQSGGTATALADLAPALGVRIPALTPDATATLGRLLPDFATPSNPLDVTGALVRDLDAYMAAVQCLADQPGVGIVAVDTWLPKAPEPAWVSDLLLRLDALARRRPDKQFVSLTVSTQALTPFGREFRARLAFPCLQGVARGLRAIRALASRIDEAARARGAAAGHATERARPRPRVDIPPGARTLGEVESKALLAAYGLTPVREQLARTTDEAVAAARLIGFPVVLKIVSPDIPHKTEAGGVRAGLADERGLRAACRDLQDTVRRRRPDARLVGLLVQEEIRDGVEVLLGLTRDPQFGLALTFGLGGTLVELLRDTVTRLVPLAPGEADVMIREIRGFPLLQGFRGRPPADVGALGAAIEGLAALGEDLGTRLVELDANPLFVRAAGAGVRVADALVVLGC
jgi:acyl-CoA synthetase (NDP forming)